MREALSQPSKYSKFDMIRRQNDRIVLFLPRIIYYIAQLLFIPVNLLIGLLCYIQLEKSVWDDDGFESIDLTGTGKELDQIKIDILGDKVKYHNQKDILRLYDSLPAADAIKDLIGRTWKGKILKTRKSALDFAEYTFIRPLGVLGFRWGKRYRSAHTGDPLLLTWRDEISIPIPVWGNVGMRNSEWRGVSTATMNYDYQPWQDYFKILSDEDGEIVLLALWTHKPLLAVGLH